MGNKKSVELTEGLYSRGNYTSGSVKAGVKYDLTDAENKNAYLAPVLGAGVKGSLLGDSSKLTPSTSVDFETDIIKKGKFKTGLGLDYNPTQMTNLSLGAFTGIRYNDMTETGLDGFFCVGFNFKRKFSTADIEFKAGVERAFNEPGDTPGTLKTPSPEGFFSLTTTFKGKGKKPEVNQDKLYK